MFTVVRRLLQLLSVRCRHRHTSQPFSAEVPLARKSSDWEPVPAAGPAAQFSHYVVCFDCGQKLAYDWERMQIVQR